MGYDMDYANSEAIFEEIARYTPSYAGITYDRIEEEGMHWPCPNAEHPGTPILHTAAVHPRQGDVPRHRLSAAGRSG
jgi:predicted molibdopterin-dependent oxidoreductase YjgC